jgi:hypothetical protein|tara:strand:- start:101 stop:268 length:168 start_codon:yes stop_codon:yes gene_type:complete
MESWQMDMLEANNVVREYLKPKKIPNNRSQKMKGMNKIMIVDFDTTSYHLTLFYF